jgi:hypothetical protein
VESGKDCVEFDAGTAVIPRAVDTQPILVVFDAHSPLSGARDDTVLFPLGTSSSGAYTGGSSPSGPGFTVAYIIFLNETSENKRIFRSPINLGYCVFSCVLKFRP